MEYECKTYRHDHQRPQESARWDPCSSMFPLDALRGHPPSWIS